MGRSPAMRAYNRRMIWLSLGYAVFLISAVYGFKHDLLRGSVAYVFAILPALPIIGIFGAMGRYLVEETDEYVRMLMVRQTLWASGFTLSLATIWGFLESFDLAGHVDGYWVAIAWFFGLGIGGLVNKVQFGASGSGC
jgi:hypothetical protein